MNILERINKLNNQRNWSDYQLSKHSGISASVISDWYRKNQTPTLKTIEKLCEAYGITFAQFFCEGKEPPDLTEDQFRMLQEWSTLSPTEKERTLTFISWMKDKE